MTYPFIFSVVPSDMGNPVDREPLMQISLPQSSGIASTSTASGSARSSTALSDPAGAASPAARPPTVARVKPIPYDSFPEIMKDCLREKLIPSRKARRDLNKVLANYIVEDLKDFSHDSVQSVCLEVAGKYPVLLERVDGKIVGNGVQNFTQNLYSCVQFRRVTSGTRA